MADVRGPRQTYPGVLSFSSPCLGRGRPRRKQAPAAMPWIFHGPESGGCETFCASARPEAVRPSAIPVRQSLEGPCHSRGKDIGLAVERRDQTVDAVVLEDCGEF